MLRSRPLGGKGLALGHGLAALEAQVHGNIVAGAALAGLGAAQDGIDQAGRDAELARQLGLREALLVHPLAGLFGGALGRGWGRFWLRCAHGVAQGADAANEGGCHGCAFSGGLQVRA